MLLSLSRAFAQQFPLERGSVAFFDSLDRRIAYLQAQIPRLKQNMDVSYYNQKRALDLALFEKTCEEYVLDEDLESAKKLVKSRIDRAEFRRDQYSIKFYHKYADHINALIKQQRIHYQALFSKEKNFKKEYEKLAAQGKSDNYAKTLRMVNLAIRYARENHLTETIKYLENYLAFTQALIYDSHSAYDLAKLTHNAKEFEKVFLPMVKSDSLKNLQEAKDLLLHCMDYSKLAGSTLGTEYFSKQALVVSAAMSDLLDKQGREKELSQYTNVAVKARLDTLNPRGVFKWHDEILVIDEFIPTSHMENVKKGEAIIHADKMLTAYLIKNKLCARAEDLKFGYTFVIPYHFNRENSSFYFNPATQKWQYIACYTSVENADFTQKISQFMPPLVFAEEKEMAESPVKDH